MEEAALDALLPPTSAVRALDNDVVIGVVFEDDELCDASDTRHFERFSSPYERIELSEVAPLPQRPRRTTFAKTVSFGRGTPMRGTPAIDARPTVEMPAVSPADTAEMPVASPADTLEMPAVGSPADTLRTAAIVPRAALVAKGTLAPRPAPTSRSALMLPIAAPADSAELPVFVPPAATVPFERVWFDDDSELAASQELVAQPKTSWRWLAISLIAAAAAVVWMAAL